MMRTWRTARGALAPLVVGVTLVVGGCGGGCPKPDSPPSAVDEWERRLDQRKMLVLNAAEDLTIKRDVHNVVVSVDAADMARAFHDVLKDPNRRFGLIEINRKRARIGKSFEVGERFQGRYVIADAIEKELRAKWEKKVFGDLVDNEAVQSILCAIENKSTSDYGEIIELDLDPPEGQPYRMAYAYLEGSPIAGSSAFSITPLGPGKSRVTQVFTYQEQSMNFATFFAAGGLKMHNQVVYSQAKQAAELAGGKILDSDIPEEYANL